MNVFKNLPLGKKLGISFGLVCGILAVVVGVTIVRVRHARDLTNQVITLRAPITQLAAALDDGLDSSLADLRGYMLLGTEGFKTDREADWKEMILPALDQLLALSDQHPEAMDKEKLTKLQQLVAQLRTTQDEIEQIARSTENLPANKMLDEEGAPQIDAMTTAIATMIEEELALEATEARKTLLGIMGDVRGSFGLSLANLRAYLVTGDKEAHDAFETLWAQNTQRLKALTEQKALLTMAQSGALMRYASAQKRFAPLAEQMFTIRGGDEWNLANHWLSTKVAPVVAETNTLVADLIAAQKQLMATDSAAAQQATSTLATLLWILLAVGVVVSMLIAYVVTRVIATPLRRVTAVAQHMSQGDFSQTIALEQQDEVGALAAAFRALTDYIQGIAQAAKAISAGDLTVQVAAKSEQDLLSQSFQQMTTHLRQVVQELTEHATMLSNAANGLSAAASQVSSNAGGLSGKITTTASGGREMSDSIAVVATSTEEMTATIGEIAQNAEKARQITVQAMHSVTTASGQVEDLNTAASAISQVTNTIMEIAEQTKLLALNATIEAARAGEAGKGFAVVANEVKALAQQTNTATEGIREKIEAIQQSTTKAVQEIGQIHTVVTEVNESVASIASAVEEQAVTTKDMAQTVSRVSHVARDIADDMDSVSGVSTEMEATSTQLQNQAVSLTQMGQALQDLVGTFKL